MEGRSADREASDGEVERAPEQVDRRDLAEETGPEALEDSLDAHQRGVEALDRRAVIGALRPVLGEGPGVGDLVGNAEYVHSAAEPLDQRPRPLQEVGDAHCLEREALAPARRLADQLMVAKVEGQRARPGFVRTRSRRQSAWRDVERRVPGMVAPG